MENLFTLLGEARAHVNIFTPVRLHRRTERHYKNVYDAFVRGALLPADAPSHAAAVAWRSAIRHGALRQLEAATEALEATLEVGGREERDTAAMEVERCLELLRRFPAIRPGRRPQPNGGGASRRARCVTEVACERQVHSGDSASSTGDTNRLPGRQKDGPRLDGLGLRQGQTRIRRRHV